MTQDIPKKSGVLSWLKPIWLSIRVPLAAVVMALLVGAVILLVSNVNPLNAYSALFKGAFGNERYLLRTLEKTTPLIFSGLAVAFAFKAGLFNIGAQGQLLMGALASAAVGFMVKGLPPLLHVSVALLVGGLVGALYGAIPGILKTYSGAHEVITTIMLNYIAINITDYFADGPWKDTTPGNIVARTPKILDSAVIPTISPPLTWGLVIVLIILILASILFFRIMRKSKFGIRKPWLLLLTRLSLVIGVGVVAGLLLNVLIPVFYNQPLGFLPYKAIPLPIGFFLAIATSVLVWFILARTSLGFEIRTIGLNQHAAKYAGIKVRILFIVAMVASGLLAGIGGSVETLGVVFRYQPGFNVGLGFDGITVALLGRNHPLGVIPAAFLIGAMKAGSNVMQFDAGVPSEIIDVVQGLMLFFVAADVIVRWVIRVKTTSDEPKVKLTSGWGNQ